MREPSNQCALINPTSPTHLTPRRQGGEYRDDITVTVIKLPCFPAARAQLVRNPAKDSAAEASPTKGAAGRRKSTAESVERRKSNLAASKKGGRRSIA